MNMRIRSRWRQDGRPASLEDTGTALANVIWRIALGFTKNLHVERFDFADDRQRVAVIGEYLAFLVHTADRMAYTRLDQQQRQRLISTTVTGTARYLQQNQAEICGPGDYRGPYVEMLSTRSTEYAETAFDEDGRPGYSALRCLGDKIQGIMGNSQTNRWVIDQVMDIDAPQTVDQLRQALENLLRTTPATDTAVDATGSIPANSK